MATAPLAGQIVRASDGFNLQTFTPVLNSATLGGSAVSEGWYQTLGKTVMWGFRIQFGSAPSFSGVITLDLPVTAYTGGGTDLMSVTGSFTYRLSSTVHYAGTMAVNTSLGTQCAFNGVPVTGSDRPSSRISNIATNPAVPVVDAVLAGSGVYRSV
jgi:hypothetical protein